MFGGGGDDGVNVNGDGDGKRVCANMKMYASERNEVFLDVAEDAHPNVDGQNRVLR